MTKIIINVSGGIVQSVQSTDPNIKVLVNDSDHDESEPDGGEGRVAELQEFQGNEKFKDIF